MPRPASLSTGCPKRPSSAALSTWAVKRTLLPGQTGTLRWQQRWGPDLLCVRYRYSPDGQQRQVTVEVVVEQGWKQTRTVCLRLPPGRADLRALVLQHGGQWVNERRQWHLPHQAAKVLNLLRYRIAG